MHDKSIKEVVDEFRSEFGTVEFKATNNETGQVGGSRNWKATAPVKMEITGKDYIALGNVGKLVPAEGVIAGLLKITLGKR